MILDIIIILSTLTVGFIGYQIGAIRLLFNVVGILLGISIGARFSLLISKHLHSSTPEVVIIVLLTGGLGILLAFVSNKVGSRLRIKILATKAYSPDKFLGVLLGIISGLLLSCFAFTLMLNLNSTYIQNTVLGSKILSFINTTTVFGKNFGSGFYFIIPDYNLSTILTAIISPQIGQSHLMYNLPQQGPFAQAIYVDYKSVPLIKWYGCGNYDHIGSGYVVAPHIVVTAAHVVSGSGLVQVENSSHSYLGIVILYDPSRDVAAIDVPGLQDTPLTLDSSIVANNTAVANLGYPMGGPLGTNNGVIQANNSLTGLGAKSVLNYGSKGSYYEMNFNVTEGESGGPLILENGEVVGHITAASVGGIGTIASTLNSYIHELQNSEKNMRRVSTGDCVLGS